MPSTASVIPMGSEKEAPSFVSQLAPKTYGLGQLDRLLLSAQRAALQLELESRAVCVLLRTYKLDRRALCCIR